MGAPVAPWHMVNDGKPVLSRIIRYKDMYFNITLDGATELPTGDFGWSHDPHMFPDVNINDFWTASAPPEATTDTKDSLESAPPKEDSTNE